MTWIVWIAVFYFGTVLCALFSNIINAFSLSRAKAIQEQNLRLIRRAVYDGMDEWIGDGDDDDIEWPARPDTLPLKFNDMDDLSSQL